MSFFNFSIWDVWNRPEVKMLRSGTKMAAKAVASEHEKSRNEQITTAEFEELSNAAQRGDSDSQCVLAIYYFENDDFDNGLYWLRKSAAKGNKYALEIFELMQG